MQNSKAKGKTITLKIKYHDFTVASRSLTFPFYISDVENIKNGWKQIMEGKDVIKKPVRLLGLSITNLERNQIQKKYIQLKFEF